MKIPIPAIISVILFGYFLFIFELFFVTLMVIKFIKCKPEPEIIELVLPPDDPNSREYQIKKYNYVFEKDYKPLKRKGEP